MAGFLIVIVAAMAAPMLSKLRTFLPIIVGWALFAPALIWLIAGPLIGAVDGHFWSLYLTGAVAIVSLAMFSLVFVRLLGLYAVIPVIGVLMFLGIPASGGGLSIYMTPDVFRVLHDILPTPAAVEAIKSILYFDSTLSAHT